jgi:hypothetical protein
MLDKVAIVEQKLNPEIHLFLMATSWTVVFLHHTKETVFAKEEVETVVTHSFSGQKLSSKASLKYCFYYFCDKQENDIFIIIKFAT